MELKYDDEKKEDAIYKSFLDDTKDMWTQREPPTIRDFLKWLIIKKFL